MRICDVEGCGRRHIAKGLCSSHYNRTRYTSEQRHPKIPQPCHVCGNIIVKHRASSGRRVVCSNECHYILRWGRPKPTFSTDLVGPVPRTCPLPQPTPSPTATRFVAATCNWCGIGFIHDLRVTRPAPLYCSRSCSRGRARAQRKASERGAPGTYTLAEVVRLWLAFGKCCAYCEQPTPGLPEPDHVLPLSRGGSNSITNILPCCHMCNSDKNDQTLDEWALDRERRGKAPRTTEWDEGDKRVAHLVLSAPTRASKVLRPAA